MTGGGGPFWLGEVALGGIALGDPQVDLEPEVDRLVRNEEPAGSGREPI